MKLTLHAHFRHLNSDQLQECKRGVDFLLFPTNVFVLPISGYDVKFLWNVFIPRRPKYFVKHLTSRWVKNPLTQRCSKVANYLGIHLWETLN